MGILMEHFRTLSTTPCNLGLFGTQHRPSRNPTARTLEMGFIKKSHPKTFPRLSWLALQLEPPSRHC